MNIRKNEISFLLSTYLIVAVFLSPVSLFAQSFGENEGFQPIDDGGIFMPTSQPIPTDMIIPTPEVLPTNTPVQQSPPSDIQPSQDTTPIYVETESNTTVNINDPQVEIVLTNKNGELDAKVLMPNDAQQPNSTIADSFTPVQNPSTTTAIDNSSTSLVPPSINDSTVAWPTLTPDNLIESSPIPHTNEPTTTVDSGFVTNFNNFVNDTLFNSTPSGVQTLVDESQGFTAATQTLAGVLADRIQSSLRENSETVIEQHLATYQVEVDADAEGNIILSRNHVAVTSAVPLVYNAASQVFSVRLDTGDKQITFLPDTVKLTLENNRDINSDISMTLGVEENELIYIAEGCQKEYFVALIPVCPDKTVTVSARTNEVTNIQQSFFSRIIDAVSIGA